MVKGDFELGGELVVNLFDSVDAMVVKNVLEILATLMVLVVGCAVTWSVGPIDVLVGAFVILQF